MEESKRRFMCCLQLFCLLFIGCLALEICADSSNTIFYESFDESFEKSWTVSANEDYLGAWKHSKSEGHDDYGLLVTEKARKYAIVKELDKPIELVDHTTVLQFETRLQNGLECGGAYLKFLRPQEDGWTPKQFDNKSPYSIMFGPDKCGSTDKVHFIVNLKNPMDGNYYEHHLKAAPSVALDKLSHVYTAIVKPDDEVIILIDGKEEAKANITAPADFHPQVRPDKTIHDPEDKMPEDWDGRLKIPDPNATKPDDWDEDAPLEIVDEDAKMPEGWLVDEPYEVDDPDAVKPEEWDDEEDGEWEPPKIDNPKCESAPGCGEWTKPMKRNPDYKGAWYAPLIDNPNYMGVWKAREIPNPNYYEIGKLKLEPITGVGIEIWTMQDGILFDNILITRDENEAAAIRDATWKPKFSVEKENQTVEEQTASLDGLKGTQKAVFDVLHKIADLPFLGDHKMKVLELIEEAEKQPSIVVGIVISIVVVLVSPLLKILLGNRKKSGKGKDGGKSSSSGETDEDAAAAHRRRNTRRDS